MSEKGEGSERGKTPRGSVAGSQHGGSQRGGSQHGGSQQSSKSVKTPRGRHNKIYRCPPTPPPQDLMRMEKGFTLDCNATSSISTDYSKANPKLGPVIPPYNSQRDRHTYNYYNFIGVDRTLKKTGQHMDLQGCSIEGPVMDRFHTAGAGYNYLSMRNQFGAGHSRSSVDGHSQFMEGIKPVMGYNGRFGYRRNTPWLRQMPSPFGTASTSPTN